MPIRVTCLCGKKYMFKDEFAGRRAKCQACGQVVQIPRLPPDRSAACSERAEGAVPPSSPAPSQQVAPETKQRGAKTQARVDLDDRGSLPLDPDWLRDKPDIVEALQSSNDVDRAWAVDLLDRYVKQGVEEAKQLRSEHPPTQAPQIPGKSVPVSAGNSNVAGWWLAVIAGAAVVSFYVASSAHPRNVAPAAMIFVATLTLAALQPVGTTKAVRCALRSALCGFADVFAYILGVSLAEHRLGIHGPMPLEGLIIYSFIIGALPGLVVGMGSFGVFTLFRRRLKRNAAGASTALGSDRPGEPPCISDLAANILAASQHTLLNRLRSPDPEMRGSAAIEIGDMGDAGTFAIPRLIDLLEDSDWIVRANSAAALGAIGGPACAPAIAALKELLNVRTRDDRTGAVWAHFALARITGEPEKHVDAIFKELRVLDVDIASAAANALGGLGPVADIVPRLVEIVKIGTGSAEGACVALGLIGPRAKEAIPVLRESAQNSPYANVRSVSRDALSQIGDA